MPAPSTLLCLGEIVWDIYPDRRLLGGAPFNLAAHAARLGFDARLISAVGDDALGREALKNARDLGVDTSLTRIHGTLPTGVVDVTLDGRAQPTFHLRRPSAWEEPRVEAVPKADWLVCGTLQQTCPQARATRLRLLGIPLFYDINLRPGFEDRDTAEELLSEATVVKCNEAELAWLGEDEASLLRRHNIAAVCVTLGARGCRIHANGEAIAVEAPTIEAVDTVGAGDAWSAAALYGFAQQWPLDHTARFANQLGAIVASRAGAIPDWSLDELEGSGIRLPKSM